MKELMQKFLLLFIAGLVILTSCKKIEIEKGTPGCIKHKIKEVQSRYVGGNPSVAEYSYKGENVYVFSPGGRCGNEPKHVYDSHCNLIGIMMLGLSDENYMDTKDFFDNATFIKTIWTYKE